VSFQVTFIDTPDYLHAIITGENSFENVTGYLQQVREECRRRGYRRLLIEEHLEGPRLSGLEVFRIVTEGSERARGELHAIAYVDANAHGALMKFAEDVAVNRALRVAVFSSIPEAQLWLLSTVRPRQ